MSETRDTATILKFVAPNAKEKPALMNSMQITSLNALTAYVSCRTQISEDSIEKVTSRRFGAESYKKLPSQCFDQVIQALTDPISEYSVHRMAHFLDLMESRSNEKGELSKLELGSLEQITFGVSLDPEIQKLIQKKVSSKFGVDCYSKIQSKDYNQACSLLIRFSDPEIFGQQESQK